MRGQKVEVAPFYDRLCVEAYSPWATMAFEARVAPCFVRGVLMKTVAQFHDGISRVIGDERLSADERDFIRGRILSVIGERCGFVGATLKSWQSNVPEVPASREIDQAIVDRLAAMESAHEI